MHRWARIGAGWASGLLPRCRRASQRTGRTLYALLDNYAYITLAGNRIARAGAGMQPFMGLLGWLILANVVAWAWALVAFHEHFVLLGTALLAWSLGLRHAVDADHIAAIDNVTRKLMQAGR